jgi:hypothetical protein
MSVEGDVVGYKYEIARPDGSVCEVELVSPGSYAPGLATVHSAPSGIALQLDRGFEVLSELPEYSATNCGEDDIETGTTLGAFTFACGLREDGGTTADILIPFGPYPENGRSEGSFVYLCHEEEAGFVENSSSEVTVDLTATSSPEVVSFRQTSPHTTYAGRTVPINASGLAPREECTVTLDGTTLGSCEATQSGRVHTRVEIPVDFDAGSHDLRVVGSEPKRFGENELVLRSPAPIRVNRRYNVKAGGNQTVSVGRMLNGEGVTVRYDDTVISPQDAQADHRGQYSITFGVGSQPGPHEITVTGDYDGRSTSKAFKVANS